MELHELMQLMKNIIAEYPQICDLLICSEQSTSSRDLQDKVLDIDALFDSGYILFEINEESLANKENVKCRLFVTGDDETLHIDILCAHEEWRLSGIKQRPIELGTLLFEAINEKICIDSKPLRFWSSEQIAVDDVIGGLTILFGTHDFLSGERSNPFHAYDVIAEEVFKRFSDSDVLELFPIDCGKRALNVSTLLEQGIISLSPLIEPEKKFSLLFSINYSTDYTISMDITGSSEESIWVIHDKIEEIMLGIPGVKVRTRGEINLSLIHI